MVLPEAVDAQEAAGEALVGEAGLAHEGLACGVGRQARRLDAVEAELEEGEGDPAAGATRTVNWAIYAAFAGTMVIGILPFLATGLTDAITLAVIR